MPEGRGLHGVVQDNPILNKLLDYGNQLRYGVTEDERMKMVNALSAPGVKKAAYDERGIFDPAAAERHTSAYLFGKRFAPIIEDPGRRALAHAISSGGRKTLNAVGFPGVGEERPELESAEEAGMVTGANEGRRVWRRADRLRLGRGRQARGR